MLTFSANANEVIRMSIPIGIGLQLLQFDTGNTAFMLIATSLVMLMTPGLAFFYGFRPGAAET